MKKNPSDDTSDETVCDVEGEGDSNDGDEG